MIILTIKYVNHYHNELYKRLNAYKNVAEN